MDTGSYIPRLIDEKIRTYLSAFGAICIEGPKWCGKTETSLHHANSSIYIGSPMGNFSNRTLAQMDPFLVLEGDTPRLLDEWQEVPSLWDAVRFTVDARKLKGQFILTGSSTPNRKGVLHSGAARIANIRMNPMSLFESGASTGAVSLRDMFQHIFVPSYFGDVRLRTLIEYIIRGGWPGSVGLDFEYARLLPSEYMQNIINNDIDRLDEKKRDLAKIRLLLRSLARNESTTVSNRVLIQDIKQMDDGDIHAETVSDYLHVFERLFLLRNQQPFSTNIRSTVRIRQAEKRHFADPSLACALLGATAESLLSDMELLGFLFEALCERDLHLYAEANNAKLFHYQDYSNNEIDAVVEWENSEWGAFEIKLGANQIDAAAHNLLRIQEEMKEDPKGKPPILLCVISGLVNAAYQRDDGVYVVPITALGP